MAEKVKKSDRGVNVTINGAHYALPAHTNVNEATGDYAHLGTNGATFLVNGVEVSGRYVLSDGDSIEVIFATLPA